MSKIYSARKNFVNNIIAISVTINYRTERNVNFSWSPFLKYLEIMKNVNPISLL